MSFTAMTIHEGVAAANPGVAENRAYLSRGSILSVGSSSATRLDRGAALTLDREARP
jgi:phage tail protein X